MLCKIENNKVLIVHPQAHNGLLTIHQNEYDSLHYAGTNDYAFLIDSTTEKQLRVELLQGLSFSNSIIKITECDTANHFFIDIAQDGGQQFFDWFAATFRLAIDKFHTRKRIT